MVQFDATRRTLPRFDMYWKTARNGVARKSRYTGAAWLSSARVVRCWVKSRNERNPCELLPPVARPSTLFRLPCETGRKVGTTSSQYGPYGQGCTRTTMPGTKGSKTVRWSKSQKTGLSSDWSLQLDSMKLESLVIVDQQRYGEYVPGPCTHRPSSHGSRVYLKSVTARSCLG